MAKFCGNCGTMLDEKTMKCPNCGTPTGVDPTSKLVGKIVTFSLIGIVVLIAAIVGIKIASTALGYKGLVNKFEKAYTNYDYEAIVDMYSIAELYEYEFNEEALENNVKYKIQNTLSSFDSRVGHSYKLKYKIQEAYDMPKYRVEAFKSSHSYFNKVDNNIITKAKIVKLEVTAVGKEMSVSRNMELIVTKEKGKWKIADFYYVS